MKTKNDYRKEVLGLSLMGVKNTVQATDKRNEYLFYCSNEDFEMNKNFVQKILKASGKNDEIVVTNLLEISKLNPLKVFSFGEEIELMNIKTHAFPSFTEIFKSSKDKALLWNELKKNNCLIHK